MIEEEWRDIVIEKNDILYNFEGKYQVSNMGRVRRLDYRGTGKTKILKLNKLKSGYVYIGLQYDGKQTQFQVHRLVATMFIPNPNNLPVVNHKDENPSNNSIENLEWCTHQYNTNYGTAMERRIEKIKGREFSEEQKQKMSDNHADFTGSKNPRARKIVCIETGQVFTTLKEAAEWCGVGIGAISNCCAGRNKTCGGYHWQYYNDYLNS